MGKLSWFLQFMYVTVKFMSCYPYNKKAKVFSLMDTCDLRTYLACCSLGQFLVPSFQCFVVTFSNIIEKKKQQQNLLLLSK